MDDMNRNLAEAAEAVERDLRDNVVPLRPEAKPLGDALAERVKLADLHRRYVAQREQRIADTQRQARKEAARIGHARDAELARHEQAMGRLEREEAELCATTAAATKADRNVVAACRALLATLDEEG